MKRTEILSILQNPEIGKEVNVKGWVRTKRGSKNVSFIALNDGSTINNLQVVVEEGKVSDDIMSKVTTGASISVDGVLVESAGSGQKVEMLAKQLDVLGVCDPEEYPLQPKKHSLEFMREIAHLRFRSNTFSAIHRIRHHLIFAIHTFFTERGFFNIHTPIITGSDCEGAGQMFRVTTLNDKNPPLNDQGEVDYDEDFFGLQTNLTVSGQLEVELACMTLGKVYTFGPTFRAENSNTSRHLAEFWMIEPEVAFNDIVDNMDLAEEMLKYLVQSTLDNCADDIAYLAKRLEDEEKNIRQEERSGNLIERLRFVVDNQFERLTYTEAIEILKHSNHYKKNKFQYDVEWGIDLQSEHERYLVEKHFKKPVILTDYPKDIKAFYMKLNEDGKTVRAMDILFPQIGEIVGGSQREENYDKLKQRIAEMNLPLKDLWWYMDTRRFGTVVHAGYGLGFERLLLFVTGMSNVRDVIAFPRTPQNAQF